MHYKCLRTFVGYLYTLVYIGDVSHVTALSKDDMVH